MKKFLMHKHFLIALASIPLIICFWFLSTGIIFLFFSVVPDKQGIQYTVRQGVSLKAVVQDLYSLNIIKHPDYFDFLIYLKRNENQLKAGEYLFAKGSSPAHILTQITTGSGMVRHAFTIIAGWDFKHLREMLEHEPNLRHETVLLSDMAIMRQIGHSEINPEGRFFPETYYFLKDSSDLALLKRAFQMMQNKLDELWKARDLYLPYQTQNEILTVASLVEKETAIDKERPVIAGVIVNRLKKNMLLQIDPTVIYATGVSFDGKIHKSELKLNNPYNTYQHKGLPPTPIAIPSMPSILAALHPEQHHYYYFVAKTNNPDSEHQFSETLEEHNNAVSMVRDKPPIAEHFNEKLIKNYFPKPGVN